MIQCWLYYYFNYFSNMRSLKFKYLLNNYYSKIFIFYALIKIINYQKYLQLIYFLKMYYRHINFLQIFIKSFLTPFLKINLKEFNNSQIIKFLKKKNVHSNQD